MTYAICDECGEGKSAPFAKCQACGSVPSGLMSLPVSLALSEHISTTEELLRFASMIKSHRTQGDPSSATCGTVSASVGRSQAGLGPSDLREVARGVAARLLAARHLPLPIEIELSARATEALKDPLFLAKLGLDHPTQGTPIATAMHHSPFWLLGASVRDDRRRIIELADEKSLENDSQLCRQLCSDLITPRTRLACEIAWLPGVSPGTAQQLVGLLAQDPQALRAVVRLLGEDPRTLRSGSGVPTLAHVNLLAAVFEAIEEESSPQEADNCINDFADLVEYYVKPADVWRDVNADRAIAGFPAVTSTDAVEEEVANRKRYLRDAIKAFLNRMSLTTLVESMTCTVRSATMQGTSHAPELIDDLVDSYEVESQSFLQKEAENAMTLIQATRDVADRGEAAITPLVDKLEAVARNWNRVAQPIQLSRKARGVDHAPSRDLAFSIRSLGIHLFNEHDMLIQSRRITDLLSELFSELPEIAERVKQDVEALEGIVRSRKEAADRKHQTKVVWQSDRYTKYK